jgi:hypothetical protein
MKKILLYHLLIICSVFSTITSADPFAVLGIPSLDPKIIFNQISSKKKFQNVQKKHEIQPQYSPNGSIENLIKFLQSNNLNESEGLKTISRYLIADDYLLKKNGAIFDRTGSDGLNNQQQIYPEGSKERLAQRANSAAEIYIRNNFNNNSYQPYGAELLKPENTYYGWEIFKVLLIGGNNANDNIFLQVCMPIDEYLTPLVTSVNGNCIEKVINI